MPIVGKGTRLQSGIPNSPLAKGRKANGLLVKGVVTATYVTDDPHHPASAYPATSAPVGVYCDVLVFPSIGGQRWFGLRHVLVSQDVSGVHRGRIWKPRATTIDVTGAIECASNPAHLDGDWVLVGFMNDSLDQPVILRAIPHPLVDTGRDKQGLGQRMKLTLADGDPDFFRHHGVHYGVDDDGDYTVDSTFANNGSVDSKGIEPIPPTDGTGSQTFKLPMDAAHKIILYDMTDPTTPVEQAKITVLKDSQTTDIKDAGGKVHVMIENGETLTIEKKGATATLVLGNGAVKATIADHLQVLWGLLLSEFIKHKHPTGTGPSGVPDTPLPSWDTNINSQKLTFPDN